ncbi:unnamed protein product [Tuber melanosporum]|uniref:(Perigord truffle) hypothetical protein n=1 Tax=Tuber melanosporum (strain Mel28) TaxID=656061 RepID=D5GNA3_TUBMM|nr:uncharacterized protein GSTUM_00011193001 [Tuber melanosporum]CAZ85996.1 unnamed protein product [Tuber melanosporum]
MTQDQIIGTYVHIPGKPREQHALYMLRWIASLVKPIMNKGGYKVGCLAEFYPVQKSLLGLNVNNGEKVCIRLRQPYDDSVFLDIEECVYTMLHEITHNLHGPHNDTFYAHLKTLEESYSTLRRGGYDGEGFYSEGKRLGAGIPKNPLMSEARRRALAMAEKRRDIYSGSGQMLGGGKDPLPSGLGIREKIAAATERRIRDSQTCGAGSGARDRGAMEAEAERTIRAGTVTVGEEEEEEETKQEVVVLDEDPENEAAIMNAAIELIQEAEREEAEQKLLWEEQDGIVWIVDDEDGPIQVELPPAAATTAATTPSPPHPRIPAPIVITSSPPPPPPAEPQDLPPSYEQATTWACDLCTLINPSILPRCEACSFERPDSTDSATSPPPTPLSPIYQNPPLTQAVIEGKERERERQKVRFLDMPLMIPEKRGEAATPAGWMCVRCGTGNGEGWWGCGGCGVVRGEI